MISFYNQQEKIYAQPILLTKCDAFLSKKGYLEERNVGLFCFYLNWLIVKRGGKEGVKHFEK